VQSARPMTEDLPTALLYIDEFIAQSDDYPIP
jgi:hypothetical protein